jgi:hypothetical protein
MYPEWKTLRLAPGGSWKRELTGMKRMKRIKKENEERFGR